MNLKLSFNHKLLLFICNLPSRLLSLALIPSLFISCGLSPHLTLIFFMALDSLLLGFNPMIWHCQPVINVCWYPSICASTTPHQTSVCVAHPEKYIQYFVYLNLISGLFKQMSIWCHFYIAWMMKTLEMILITTKIEI